MVITTSFNGIRRVVKKTHIFTEAIFPHQKLESRCEDKIHVTTLSIIGKFK